MTVATSHQWLGLTPSKISSEVPGMANARRFGDRTIWTSLSRSPMTANTSVGDSRLACHPSLAIERRLAMNGPSLGTPPQRTNDLAGRPQHSVAAGPGAVVQHDMTAAAHDAHGLFGQPDC